MDDSRISRVDSLASLTYVHYISLPTGIASFVFRFHSACLCLQVAGLQRNMTAHRGGNMSQPHDRIQNPLAGPIIVWIFISILGLLGLS